jgi:putative transposase
LARCGGQRSSVEHRSLAPTGLADLPAREVQSVPTTDSARTAQANSQDGRGEPVWGEERIANELLLKLGIRVSPGTVGKYLPKRPSGQPRGDQRWATFLKNHAKGILACDFFVAVTAPFRLLYAIVVMEQGTRSLAHVKVTAHPRADWTLQPLRAVVADEGAHQYLIHERDKILARHLDASIRALGMEMLRSPVASAKANSICERVIGTIRKECLEWMIPRSEAHLRSILKS